MDILTKLWPLLLVYLAAINLLSCVLTVADKRRAKRRAWRVPEATLLWVAALGGAPLELLTMKLIRHKTQHRKFLWGLPAILIAQIAAAAAVWWLIRG